MIFTAVCAALSCQVAIHEPQIDQDHDLLVPPAEPRLPRVLILGDSISIGYTPMVREMLLGEAVVVRPMQSESRAENCQGTTYGIDALDRWLGLGGGEWDVIHFNFGLHDLKRVDAETRRNSNDPQDPPQASLEQYEKNLRRMVTRMSETEARLIFATTTPVPPGGVKPHRDVEDPARYNAVASKIMRENGVAINDLHEFALPRLAEIQQPVNVHFTPTGSQALAGEVVRAVRHALNRSRSGQNQFSDGRPPNIVFLLADDLGYNELGSYGQKWIRTPHLDRLAQEGMRFTQHYSGNAVCAPSRCAFLTGKHMGHAYIRDNGNPPDRRGKGRPEDGFFPGQYPLPNAEVTLAEMLKQQGYATAAIGKWGLGYEGSTGDPNFQGFDLFYGYLCQVHAHNHYPRFLWRNGQREWFPGNDRTLSGNTYSQDKFTEVALDFIRSNRQRPFFLYLPFAIPHLSIQVPDASLAQYRGQIPEEPYEHRDGYLKFPQPRAGYAAMISHLDRDIGLILAELKKLELDEHTLVVFTSDNGPTYNRLGGSDSDFFESAGPLRGLKGSLYEGGIRVPMIARWPGRIPAGTVSDHLSAFWDWMPTLGEITGTQPPAGADGLSFAATLLGQPQKQVPPTYLYWEFPSYGGQQALRWGQWKAIRQNLMRPKAVHAGRWELYDLSTDLGETQDVADQHLEIVNSIRAWWRESHRPSALFPFPALDD